MEYTAIIQKLPSGWYMGQCEQMPGAITQGRTIEETKENLKEAITLLLEDAKEDFRVARKGERFLRRKIAIL